ncbi:N-6 DNA methylase [Psychrobacter sp. 16-MNA-CIBAN-0192]|uniref:HsdM family class I SAM-dependent methyltransferase n=1 Tax=Psychrobacter sp. 16-MNA-CIBAN-0192 TaxID=3140448 RepID=UPI00333072F4
MGFNDSEVQADWLFKDLIESKGYTNNDEVIVEFRDKTKNKLLKKQLEHASKKGNKNGIPDFIIRSQKHANLVFLIECKADPEFHESRNGDMPVNYAVDGVLWYSSFVSKEFDVIAIALSGNTDNYKISSYMQLRGTDQYSEIKSSELLTYENYVDVVLKSDISFNRDYETLLSYAKRLNSDLHKLKIKESKRALLISGVLIALQDESFRISFHTHASSSALISTLIISISSQLRIDKKKDRNSDTVLSSFSFLKTSKSFTEEKEITIEKLVDAGAGKTKKETVKIRQGLWALIETITSIRDNVYYFLEKYKYVDTLSQFYIEFLRYANTDKGLGIVLTPIHIAKLFVKMAGVNQDTIVLDNAAGTGGFLIAAMGEMVEDAGDNQQKIDKIREDQIYGIEYDEDIYSLLASNMIVHSDGRSNIRWGSSFDVVPDELKKITPNHNIIDVGLLNPPFKSDKDDVEEFDFIFSCLDAVTKGGTVIALVPTNIVTVDKGISYQNKKKLLENHTLEAVVSLPEDLFSNSKTSVVTVGIVITAHRPHPPRKTTWFGYWRNDGFVKTSNFGRTDINNEWYGENGLQEYWLSAFINREDIPQFSINKVVCAEDEWLAEAFLKTDYTLLSESDFEKTVRQYYAFKLENNL